ncbi:3-oxo-tetronate kinase [Bosea sp. (in: a-proteobacteria)]|uniref:3-oxo-tetronate kinase n=1 Tax=Bosea sp. (in: a-proteobacteria) TaxID=1871050 RepID=UPI00260E81D8|nr:3-oxo-tetronate kinase [Bosea sp. (in: a-proteobacteria)]MCO5092492.1 four-carbon acid sugar kinase family protein [Bosea sp. (in: a-proteobacteria)]
MLLGVIADDMTGATDVALMLSRAGMRTVQVIGAPSAGAGLPEADAVVVALKSRTNPVVEAVADSLAACEALLKGGARQILFKYCSTFDSTAEGNIGPVANALMERLGAKRAIICPAFPANGRSIYQGCLFVGALPLHESPMKDHPLTPMRDSNLMRLMSAQAKTGVGLVDYATVLAGPEAVKARLATLEADGVRYAVTDAVTDEDLMTLGRAVSGDVLVTGGSGIAMGLPRNFRSAGLLPERAGPPAFTAPPGRAGILSGSCSTATRGQIEAALAAGYPALKLDPLALAEGRQDAAGLAAWALAQPADRPFLVYSSSDPAEVSAVQERLGRERAGSLVEHTFAELARRLAEGGVTRLLVAGGETSGAAVLGLAIRTLEIGCEIDPGVPWTRVVDGPRMVVALKSGNFGAPDFFVKAWTLLGPAAQPAS